MAIDPELLKQLRLEKNNDFKATPFVHLQQLYEFEFSPITKYQLNQEGLYDQASICKHWSKHGVDIYIAYRNEIPIGFAVVNLSSMISGDATTRDMAELFVMPCERKNKIGKWLKFEVMMRYPGKWESRQLPDLDQGTLKLLDKITDEFTGGNYTQEIRNDAVWHGRVSYFESNAESRKRVEHWLIAQ